MKFVKRFWSYVNVKSAIEALNIIIIIIIIIDEASSARNTVAIHKEKFSVPLNELYRFQKHLKTLPGLEEITRSKGLGEKPKSTRSRSLEFKRQAVALKEPIYILHLLAFAEISLF